MIKQRLTIDKTATGYVLNVDGGSIECSTAAEVMSRVGHEMGMPFNKAQRQLFERMEAAEQALDNYALMNDKLTDENETLCTENQKLRAAIVAWFLRAFKEG